MGNPEEMQKEDEGGIQHAKTKMLNIFLLGLCFCFVFTGFNTMGQTQVIGLYKIGFSNCSIAEPHLRRGKELYS